MRQIIVKIAGIIGIIILKYLVAMPFLIIYFLLAIWLRASRTIQHRKKPRILWGTQAIGGTQYYSQACQKYGYQSNTLMYASFHSNRPQDFDYYPWTLFPGKLFQLPFVYKYMSFLWAFPRYEVLFHNFNGGLLYRTIMEKLEIHLWHLSGAKVIVYPYGGDAQVISRVNNPLYKHTLLLHYPELAAEEEGIIKRLRFFTRHADFVFTSVEHVDYLPYWDLLLMQMSAIDTDRVNPSRMQPGKLRRLYPEKTIIFHASNHRHIKGTNQLIQACEELKSEGCDDFELVIYDRRPNTELLQAIFDSDIVADQFVIGLYAMFGIESMAMEKPILCYFRPDLYELFYYYSWAGECPLVNTPLGQIKENITYLLDHPDERKNLGIAGRQYVEKHHSLAAMGKLYDAIIQKVWNNVDNIDGVMKEQDRRFIK